MLFGVLSPVSLTSSRGRSPHTQTHGSGYAQTCARAGMYEHTYARRYIHTYTRTHVRTPARTQTHIIIIMIIIIIIMMMIVTIMIPAIGPQTECFLF